MSGPKLSVILPNYNHAAFLPRCIEAILNQSFSDLELIVVDDASTDHSREVIESYARQDSRVRFYRNAENKGVIGTLIRALELTRAEYVFGAAADDYVLPGFFDKAMGLLSSYPQAGLCVGLTECVDDNGRVRYVAPDRWLDGPGYIPGSELPAKMMVYGIPGPVIWRKAAFLEAGGYYPELRWHGDWFPLNAVAFRYGACFFPEKTTVVRMAEDSYSANMHRRAKDQRAVLRAMFGIMADPRFADVLGRFTASGILRQFGPELVRAAATDPHLPSAMLVPLREHVYAHASNLLREPEAEVRAGMAALVGRYGREAFTLYDLLREKQGDPEPAVSAAAALARAAIRRDLPFVTLWKHRVRRVVGTILRVLDRTARPLHHQRMERLERLLTEMLAFHRNEMYQALSDLYQQLDRVKDAIRETASPIPAERDESVHVGSEQPRAAA